MQDKFSKELIDKTIKHFANKYNHHIDEDTANEYLRSFARLFLAFTRENKEIKE